LIALGETNKSRHYLGRVASTFEDGLGNGGIRTEIFVPQPWSIELSFLSWLASSM